MLSCPGSDAEHVFAVRRRDDVDAIMKILPDVAHVAVVGGGYIGLEAAAVLTKLGKKVKVLEAMERVLARNGGGSCREGVCKEVWISVVADRLKKKIKKKK